MSICATSSSSMRFESTALMVGSIPLDPKVDKSNIRKQNGAGSYLDTRTTGISCDLHHLKKSLNAGSSLMSFSFLGWFCVHNSSRRLTLSEYFLTLLEVVALCHAIEVHLERVPDIGCIGTWWIIEYTISDSLEWDLPRKTVDVQLPPFLKAKTQIIRQVCPPIAQLIHRIQPPPREDVYWQSFESIVVIVPSLLFRLSQERNGLEFGIPIREYNEFLPSVDWWVWKDTLWSFFCRHSQQTLLSYWINEGGCWWSSAAKVVNDKLDS